MPAVFKKVKVKNHERANDNHLMVARFIAQYEEAKSVFDGADQADKDQVVESLNKFSDGLGDAFATDKLEFEMVATDISDIETFVRILRDECGFDLELVEDHRNIQANRQQSIHTAVTDKRNSQPSKPSKFKSDSYSEITSQTQTFNNGKQDFLPSADESQPTQRLNDGKPEFLPLSSESHVTHQTSSHLVVEKNKSVNNISSKKSSLPPPGEITNERETSKGK